MQHIFVKSHHAAFAVLFLILSIISTAFAVCIPKKIPKDFRLPVPRLYPGERIMLLLGAEASFKPGGHFP